MKKARSKGRPRPSEPPPTERSSYVRVTAALPCILLVRVGPDEEAMLDLDALPVRVLRCKHPVPACQRARVMRPLLVVAGADVREWSRPMLMETCHDVGAAMVQLGPLIARDALVEWMRAAMARVVEKRSAAG